jgi:hypothetical protein
MFTCDQCLRIFKTRAGFTSHYRTHTVNKQPIIEECPREIVNSAVDKPAHTSTNTTLVDAITAAVHSVITNGCETMSSHIASTIEQSLTQRIIDLTTELTVRDADIAALKTITEHVRPEIEGLHTDLQIVTAKLMQSQQDAEGARHEAVREREQSAWFNANGQVEIMHLRKIEREHVDTVKELSITKTALDTSIAERALLQTRLAKRERMLLAVLGSPDSSVFEDVREFAKRYADLFDGMRDVMQVTEEYPRSLYGVGQMVNDYVISQQQAESVRQADMQAATQCVVCLDSAKTDILLPCGHYVLCSTCAAAVKKCPVCRAVIKQRATVYMS